MKSLLSLILAFTFIGASVSCTSKLTIAYESNPPAAQLVEDGRLVGVTPCTLPYEVSQSEAKVGSKHIIIPEIRWVSGARIPQGTKTVPVPPRGKSATIPHYWQRPSDAPGLAQDQALADKLQKQRLIALQAEETRQAQNAAQRGYERKLRQQQQATYQSNYQLTTASPSFTSSIPKIGAVNLNRYDPNSLANPYGAGSPYKSDGLMNPYSEYGSSYSNKSWNNPYATDAPKLYDANGNYRGKLSTNKYDPDSISNPYGRYGSEYSPESINNPYGAGNPYSTTPIYVVPSQ